mmetsp:Transcript_25042/g.42884  ORF Transcript_25042/g.42884 Transcript_25042/m.42884 type:complete len:125 (+) Transcript_25042:477-851(+)
MFQSPKNTSEAAPPALLLLLHSTTRITPAPLYSLPLLTSLINVPEAFILRCVLSKLNLQKRQPVSAHQPSLLQQRTGVTYGSRQYQAGRFVSNHRAFSFGTMVRFMNCMNSNLLLVTPAPMIFT